MLLFGFDFKYTLFAKVEGTEGLNLNFIIINKYDFFPLAY